MVVCGLGLTVHLFIKRAAVPGKSPEKGTVVERRPEAPASREQAGTEDAGAGPQFATAAQRRAYERELFSAVRAIPAAQLEENRDGYARLLELAPQNAYYRKKFEYYRDRIKERPKSFQEQVRDLLDSPGLESGALSGELIARGVVEKTGVPGAVPRLWVAPGFYALDFATQQQVVEVFYRHYRGRNPAYDTVMIYDGVSGKMVGIYGEVQGGLSLQ